MHKTSRSATILLASRSQRLALAPSDGDEWLGVVKSEFCMGPVNLRVIRIFESVRHRKVASGQLRSNATENQENDNDQKDQPYPPCQRLTPFPPIPPPRQP